MPTGESEVLKAVVKTVAIQKIDRQIAMAQRVAKYHDTRREQLKQQLATTLVDLAINDLTSQGKPITDASVSDAAMQYIPYIPDILQEHM